MAEQTTYAANAPVLDPAGSESKLLALLRNARVPYGLMEGLNRLTITSQDTWSNEFEPDAIYAYLGQSDTPFSSYLQMSNPRLRSSAANLIGLGLDVVSPPPQRVLNDLTNYFVLRQTEAARDSQAQELLLLLYDAKQEDKALEYSEIPADQSGKALARLAAAALCDPGETGLKITEAGERFVQDVLSLDLAGLDDAR